MNITFFEIEFEFALDYSIKLGLFLVKQMYLTCTVGISKKLEKFSKQKKCGKTPKVDENHQ